MKAAILKKIGHFQTNSAVYLNTGHIWYMFLDGLWLYFWFIQFKNTTKCHQETFTKYGRCSNWPLNLFENDRYFLWIILIGIFRGESSKEKSERSTQSSRRANDTKNSTRAWMCKAYINNRTTIRALRTSVLVRTYQYMYDHFSAILILHKMLFRTMKWFSSGQKLFSRPKLLPSLLYYYSILTFSCSYSTLTFSTKQSKKTDWIS